MRIALVGAVESTLVALEALAASNKPPVLVVTLPPEAAARHSDYVDLGEHARALGAAVHFSSNVNAPDTIAALEEARIDLALVIGWSQICGEAFRATPRLGALGFHPAPLPRLRGRAVIPWTILAEEGVTGSTLFWLDEGVDSGPIVEQELFPVAADETARSLYDKHKRAIAVLVPRAVEKIAANGASGEPQNDAKACYCAKRTAADGLIDWREPAGAVLRLIRAVGDPYPGAFTFEADDKITVDGARAAAAPGRFIGMAGQVQSHTDHGFTVLCGDGSAIEIVGWRSTSGRKPRMHAKLRGG